MNNDNRPSQFQNINPLSSVTSNQNTLTNLHSYHAQAQAHHSMRAKAPTDVAKNQVDKAKGSSVIENSSQNFNNPNQNVGYSLRGNIEQLENKIADIITEISYHRQQLQIVKSEAETSNQVLNMKIDECRGRLEFEEQKI